MSGFEIKHEGAEDSLKKISEALKRELPPGFGFTLLIFSYGEGGSMFYSSTANRETMIEAMREFIAKQTL